MPQTSISDNNQYPSYCYFAAKNDAEFKRGFLSTSAPNKAGIISK